MKRKTPIFTLETPDVSSSSSDDDNVVTFRTKKKSKSSKKQKKMNSPKVNEDTPIVITSPTSKDSSSTKSSKRKPRVASLTLETLASMLSKDIMDSIQDETEIETETKIKRKKKSATKAMNIPKKTTKQSEDDEEEVSRSAPAKIETLSMKKTAVNKRKPHLVEDSDDEADRDYIVKEPEECDEETEEFCWDDDEKAYWKKCGLDVQKALKRSTEEIETYQKLDIPARFKILMAPISIGSKSMILRKYEQWMTMETSDNEYFKLQKWMDALLQIPFERKIPFPVTRYDPSPQIQSFLTNVATTLHKSVYGHEHAKERLLQFVAQSIANPNALGHCIGLVGPPGVGKTSLVKNGVATALGRPFSFLALGGASDASYLEGHPYTYEGSMWGRFVDILIQSKAMNPVIFLDELDKVSETKQGEEIIGVLTHVTDPTQNNSFQDRYFAGIDLNLSQSLLIFSLNDETKLNPILRDRMILIHMNGFRLDEKKKIAQDYCWPELLKETGFHAKEVTIPDDVLDSLLRRHEAHEESGVRNLRRLLESILLRLNVIRWYPDALVKGSIANATATYNDVSSSTDKKKKSPPATEITFPFTLTTEWAEYLLDSFDQPEELNPSIQHLYC